MRIDCKTYLEVDEIDHLTLRCRRGEPLDRKNAIRMIKYYTAVSAPVEEAFAGADVTLAALNALPDGAICDMLIKIRTVLIDTVL